MHALKLTHGQMRKLWHIKHTLALIDDNSDSVPDEFRKWRTLVKVSTLQLQAVLYNIPGSDRCNPYSEERVIVDNNDREALR